MSTNKWWMSFLKQHYDRSPKLIHKDICWIIDSFSIRHFTNGKVYKILSFSFTKKLRFLFTTTNFKCLYKSSKNVTNSETAMVRRYQVHLRSTDKHETHLNRPSPERWWFKTFFFGSFFLPDSNFTACSNMTQLMLSYVMLSYLPEWS